MEKLYNLYKLQLIGEEYYEDNSIDSKLKKLKQRCENCNKCDLSLTRTHVVCGEGSKSNLMFVGEAPGATEDIVGRPFVGRAGKLLTKLILEELTLTRNDIFITNIVKCRPPNNRVPTEHEALSCINYLYEEIEIVDPKIIVCLGKTAMKYLLGLDEPITKLRGKTFDYKGRKVLVTFHPSYLLRNYEMIDLVKSDFKLLKSML